MSGDIVELREKTLGHAPQNLRGNDLQARVTSSSRVSCRCDMAVGDKEINTHIVGHPECHLRVVVVGRQETELVVIHLTQIITVGIGIIQRGLGRA